MLFIIKGWSSKKKKKKNDVVKSLKRNTEHVTLRGFYPMYYDVNSWTGIFGE